MRRKSHPLPLLLLMVTIHFSALAQEKKAPHRFVQDRFAIGFWVDPPASADLDARYAEIAEANFTFIIGNFGAGTTNAIAQQLELCEKHGLKALVSMAGQPPERLPTNGACWGYLLADEPSAVAFPDLRKSTDAIRNVRPGKLAYVNLFPNYCPPWGLGTSNYNEHVQRFVSEVQPDVLSMDHYPQFTPTADGREDYCQNLEVMRRHSLAAGIPFWNFFNALPYGPHTDPTEAQLRWQIFTSLAYGARGVMNQKTGKESAVVDDSPDMPGMQLSFDAGEGRLFVLPTNK